MGLQMQRVLSAYFGMQKFMPLELLNLNIRSLPQGMLVQVDDIRTTSPDGSICRWLETDVHTSVLKRKMVRARFSKDLRMA